MRVFIAYRKGGLGDFVKKKVGFVKNLFLLFLKQNKDNLYKSVETVTDGHFSNPLFIMLGDS